MLGAQRSWSPLLLCLLVLATWLAPATSVKHENFKTCAQSGFCARNRAYADNVVRQGSSWTSPYKLDAASITFKQGVLLGTIIKSISATETVRLPLTITFLMNGAARVVIDEEKRQKKDIQLRHDSKARQERYNEAGKWALAGGLDVYKHARKDVDPTTGETKVTFGRNDQHQVNIKHNPFSLDFKRGGESQIKINERGFMNIEHWRPKTEQPEKPAEEKTGDDTAVESEAETGPSTTDEGTWWDESFGGNTDSKPRGPESIGLDITFPGYEHVFGIPEHSGPLSLKETRGGHNQFDEPYRLYNLDVFEYIMDSPMALYGAIPFMQAHKKDSTVGLFWLNAAESWIDITRTRVPVNPLSLGIGASADTQTHWFSESGVLDFFVLLGPNPTEVSKVYGELTGYTTLPQQFAIAYHQCRWNYVTDEDVKDVDRKFDKYNIPYDVIWLDIEYTDGKKYFTYDPLTFPDPMGMLAQLDAHERKLVDIIDPHIKKTEDYPIITALESNNYATMNKAGELFEGWCWPGSSRWIDCFNPAANTWWASLFKYSAFKGTAPNAFIWNDMNEPSVFNGPETTMPKDNLHHGNWEHRDVHNLNGMTFHNATFKALLVRDDAKTPAQRKRPFVLTRSFFAGSQRLGAMWTGDNLAEWSHLEASMPMVMNQGISGMPFAGADVGGFFGNPDKELLTRWYQAGAFYPFFRGHAHIDTRRREPYLIGEPYTGIITQALRLRYSLLPAWYTAFQAASIQGGPIVRPNWYVFPDDVRGFAIDDQMYLADTGLLVKPVTAPEKMSVDVYIADAKTYYDYFDHTVYAGAAGRTVTVPAPLEKLPLLMQAGHIIPRRDRPRRSSGLMRWDPFTLVITLSPEETSANGKLYVDDGESYGFTEGAYIHRDFNFVDGELSSVDFMPKEHKTKATTAYEKLMEGVVIEKVIIIGAPEKWSSKTSMAVKEDGKEGRDVDLSYEAASGGKAARAVVRGPGVPVGKDWKMSFE